MLHTIGQKFDKIITVEDGVIAGGMGTAIIEFMATNQYKNRIKTIGIPMLYIMPFQTYYKNKAYEDCNCRCRCSRHTPCQDAL